MISSRTVSQQNFINEDQTIRSIDSKIEKKVMLKQYESNQEQMIKNIYE